MWKVGQICLLVFLLVAVIYIVLLTKPQALPERGVLVDQINDRFPDYAARDIQDVIYIDKKHAFIPFISVRGDYGFSVWQWKLDKWEIVNINATGFPLIWKKGEDPSSYYIAWNIHPDDGVDEFHLYLKRERNFSSSSEMGNHYYPGVQMKYPVALNDRTYGVIQLPDAWVSALKALEPVQTVQTVQDTLYMFKHVPYQVNIKAMLYDSDGKFVFPERSVNGSQSTRGEFDFQHIFILDEADLEVTP